MQMVRINAAGIEGVEGFLVAVEVGRNEPLTGSGRTTVVGLPDAAVREAIDRVLPALFASHLLARPGDFIVVNLAPGDRRKEGPAFDLAIALGLAATVDANALTIPGDTLFCAELALDGTLRPVRGTLACALAARAAGLTRVVCAPANAPEAAVVAGISVHAPTTLADLVAALREGWHRLPPVVAQPYDEAIGVDAPDLADVRGQEHAKRALSIVAAGGHNLLMIGPPGSGKTMLARRLPGVLPRLTIDEALEVTLVYSVSGLLPPGIGLMRSRPFRSPHHNVSGVGLIGGGSVPRPGEVSLAHHGVLFLDELPEFHRPVLESLRQPLEDGHLTISRGGGRLRFPSRCMLVAAMNPCPCGWLGHPTRACIDNADAVHRYRGRISGPLLDRIDLHLDVPAQPPASLHGGEPGESSANVRLRVEAARARMIERQGCANSQLGPRRLHQMLCAQDGAIALLDQAATELGFSARAYDRILKVARTIADLDARDGVACDDVAEAIGYRVLDRAS